MLCPSARKKINHVFSAKLKHIYSKLFACWIIFQAVVVINFAGSFSKLTFLKKFFQEHYQRITAMQLAG